MEKLIAAIDAVLAPKATPEEEAQIREEMSRLSSAEQTAQNERWAREYRAHRRNAVAACLRTMRS